MTRRLTVVFLLLFLFSIFSACATTKKEGASSPPEEKPRASSYDFNDILVPSEMKLNQKDSFVYTSAQFKVGILSFSGNVEPDSLTSFFQNNMPKDGWRQISTLKYRETMLVFLKDERACVITIKERFFSTSLKVRVGPIDQAASQVKGTPPR
jgi:hypothetical protein